MRCPTFGLTGSRACLLDQSVGIFRGVSKPGPEGTESADRALAADELLERYRLMARIRAFEEQVGRHFREGNIHGFVHTSIGQEAVAAGTCAQLRRSDLLTTTHRGHGHCIAKGADPAAMMAELFGRETGTCRGRGGSMHLAATDLGILGANGIVGAGIPIAVGAGLAARKAGDGTVAIAFFGEGAVHSGAFHEGVGLAVAWRVPVIFVCENNQYAEFTASDGAWGAPPLVERAASYGLPASTVDGNDVAAVQAATAGAIDAARDGGGPAFLEMLTYRMGGHYEGDAEPYRLPGELDEWRARDPIARAGALLADAGKGDAADAALGDAAAEMEAAVTLALEAPYPDPSSALEDVGG
ncbi:MAG: acetoin:2,6-dichlorophenolindophenol oxidoreductase subunit alpha [Solirubrobacteraceae bacterium]|nr:acetoin:2,6-dichlorophenolindophenol oxidoreductase subunit alpha [Solirubrobacteraceae bacterium]